jgi:hypothetical protein
MSTQAQILANQANAKHSTGPRTEAGKATVAANATTHGATSKQAFIKGESRIEHEHQLAQFEAEFQPVTMHEKFLVKAMADASWRLRRLHIWEMLILEDCPADVNPFDDDAQFKKLNRAHRHIQSIEHSYHRAHRELMAARKTESTETAAAKTPEPKQTQVPVTPFRFFENLERRGQYLFEEPRVRPRPIVFAAKDSSGCRSSPQPVISATANPDIAKERAPIRVRHVLPRARSARAAAALRIPR